MNAEIARTTGNYMGLLREGKEKGYRVPLPDNRLIVLHREPARYTNAARKARAQGEIVLSIQQSVPTHVLDRSDQSHSATVTIQSAAGINRN